MVCQILELELLYCRVDKFPIHLTEAAILSKEISSAKVWSDANQDQL